MSDDRRSRRLANIGWGIAVVLVLVVLGSLVVRVRDDRDSVNLSSAVLAGHKPQAPALPSTQIDDDGAPDLPDWYVASADDSSAGHRTLLVVNFWASWCGPCREEMPMLQQIADEYDGEVTVVGVNAAAEDAESDARTFVRELRIGFPIVRGARSDVRGDWGVRGFPETFVVDKRNRVVAHVNGPVDEETIRGLVDRELA